MNSPVGYKHHLRLSNILFDDMLNIVCKPLVIAGECNGFTGQNQCKPRLVVSTELHWALVELLPAV